MTDTTERPAHHFESTGQAYDACQCDESIKTGDTLIIETEQVVGVADTWPVAVTEEAGVLHSASDPQKVRAHLGAGSIMDAQAQANRLGYALDLVLL